jgi:hypothetical protein
MTSEKAVEIDINKMILFPAYRTHMFLLETKADDGSSNEAVTKAAPRILVLVKHDITQESQV